MKKFLIALALFPLALLGQPTMPLANTRFSGTNNVVLDSASLKFGTTTPGSITGSAGALSFTAAGTNQSITLAPSGTGNVVTGPTSFTNNIGYAKYKLVLSSTGTAGDGPSLYLQGGTSGFDVGLSAQGTSGAFLDVGGNATATNNNFTIRIASANSSYSMGTVAKFTSTAHLLLGGLTTDGTGVLQFPAATTSAGGIAFGTDNFLYRLQSGYLIQDSPSGATGYIIRSAGVAKASLGQWDNGTNIQIGSEVAGYSVQLRSGAGTVAVTLGSTQNVALAAAYIGSTSTLSGPGAANVTTETTKVTTTGALDAISLADGANGQIKRVVHDVDGGSFVLTPTTKTGWSTFTSTVVGESITLVFVTTRGWMVVGNYAGVIAP